MSNKPLNANQIASIKLGNNLPGKQVFKSVNQLSYQTQKQVSTSVDVLNPYKSHTTLTWIGGNDDHYTRHNITTDPFPGSKCQVKTKYLQYKLFKIRNISDNKFALIFCVFYIVFD